MRLILLIFSGFVFINQARDLSKWMEIFSKIIQDKPITELYLPGSHDSATYQLENHIGKNQDLSNKLNYLGINNTIKNWAQAQDLSVLQQLVAGIRYLDLRVIYRDSKKEFYTVHGLYGPSLDDILKQISQFLAKNPKEIIVIQVGDLRYMPNGELSHNNLVDKLKKYFGDKIIDKSTPLDTPIKDLWQNKKQVFLIYDNYDIASKYDYLLPTKSINSYWANKDSVNDLKEALDKNLANRKEDKKQFYVIQSQMTPNNSTIAKSYIPFTKNFDNLKQMADAVKNNLVSWLSEWRSHGPAIILLDFVNDETSNKIISLNTPKKL